MLVTPLGPFPLETVVWVARKGGVPPQAGFCSARAATSELKFQSKIKVRIESLKLELSFQSQTFYAKFFSDVLEGQFCDFY